MVKLHRSIHKIFLLGYFILLGVMFVLPFFSAEGYSIIKHTTSELGAQLTPNSWVMNVTFIGLGILCVVEALFALNSYTWHLIILVLFGIGLLLSGLFRHMPIHPELPYSIREDELHSAASSLVGMSFTIFSFSSIFILTSKKNKIIAFLMGVLATLISGFIFGLPNYAGLLQRLMFMTAFAWLFYFFVEDDF